ncbi:MAG: hypothetical protein Q9184_006499 [Pyrenodesmia sp. 2 TL-2023]
MTLHLSTEDYRVSIPSASDVAASNAPEVDNALLAPECLSDNTAPEVSPGQGLQVFYVTSSPEALQIRSSENNGGPSSKNPTPPRNSRKRPIILSLTITVMVGIALGIGLWLGLKGRAKGKVETPATLPSTSATSSQPSAVATSIVSQTVSPKRILQHGILENTGIAAITLSNDVRCVFFQETTGAFRRAIYSAQANAWHVPIDDQVPLFTALPKNNTPLAAITPAYSYGVQSAILFYVNSETQAIDCIELGQDNFLNCSYLNNVQDKFSVSPFSRHISATMLVADTNQSSLLLIYPDPSGRLVVMLGYVNGTTNSDWIWRNETAKLERTLHAGVGESVEMVACTAHALEQNLTENDFVLNCFTKGIKGSKTPNDGIVAVSIDFPKTSPGDLAFSYG